MAKGCLLRGSPSSDISSVGRSRLPCFIAMFFFFIVRGHVGHVQQAETVLLVRLWRAPRGNRCGGHGFEGGAVATLEATLEARALVRQESQDSASAEQAGLGCTASCSVPLFALRSWQLAVRPLQHAWVCTLPRRVGGRGPTLRTTWDAPWFVLSWFFL